MDYIDDQVQSVNDWEERQNRNRITETVPQAAAANAASTTGKVLVGRVEQFFDKINVAAIILDSALKVGDIIEIGNEEEAIRQRISSMQIEKEDVSQAQEGESVGIKLKYKVPVGSDVYKIE